MIDSHKNALIAFCAFVGILFWANVKPRQKMFVTNPLGCVIEAVTSS